MGDLQDGTIGEVEINTTVAPEDFVPLDDDDYDGTYDPDWSCQTCGGEGFEWCEDTNSSEGCWEPDCNGRVHTCPNCRGSGARKDQWYW